MYKVLSIDIDWIQSYHHLEELNKIFFYNVDNAKKILFGKHHHQILTDLVDHNNIVIHNIDNHHDICDQDWQLPKIKDGNGYHGCWVGSLMYENKLREYYWYNNSDSEPLMLDHFGAQLITEKGIKYVVNDKLNIPSMDYDLIFVCHSPDYIPPAFHSLYESYLDCCAILYGSKSKMTELLTDLPNAPIFLSDLLEFTPKYIPTTGTANV